MDGHQAAAIEGCIAVGGVDCGSGKVILPRARGNLVLEGTWEGLEKQPDERCRQRRSRTQQHDSMPSETQRRIRGGTRFLAGWSLQFYVRTTRTDSCIVCELLLLPSGDCDVANTFGGVKFHSDIG